MATKKFDSEFQKLLSAMVEIAFEFVNLRISAHTQPEFR